METKLGGSQRETLEVIEQWLDKKESVALATVIAIWGSSPCGVGSQLQVSKERDFAGSVSGGCVEGEYLRQSLKSLEDRSPRVLDFSVSNDAAWDVGLACAGTMRFYVERLERSFRRTSRHCWRQSMRESPQYWLPAWTQERKCFVDLTRLISRTCMTN